MTCSSADAEVSTPAKLDMSTHGPRGIEKGVSQLTPRPCTSESFTAALGPAVMVVVPVHTQEPDRYSISRHAAVPYTTRGSADPTR